MRKGIDVSSHQKTIDWKKVYKDGISFAIIRAGYRKVIDDYAVKNVEGALAAGLDVGLYWFSYAESEADAKKEAELCIAFASKYNINLPIFYDFEYDTVTKAKANGVTLTKKHFNAFTKVFCDAIENAGYLAGVYYNLDYKRNWSDQNVCSRYVQWLAHYTEALDSENAVQQYSSIGRVSGISGNVDMNWLFDEAVVMKRKGDAKVNHSRKEIVELAKSWIGRKESDGSHKYIIDIYNTYLPHPRGYKLGYSDAWCAGTVSALAIKMGYTDIIPVECSCTRMIELAKAKGIWQENDAYVPEIGDLVIYDWQDGSNYASTNNTNAPDHIGIVEKVDTASKTFTVIEGNKGNAVARRTVMFNGRYIRGFVCPKYDVESASAPEVVVDPVVTQPLQNASSGSASSSQAAASKAPSYKVGKIYTLQSEMKVRTGAGTNYTAKKYNQLTVDGRKHDKDKDGCLDKGTRVSCLQIKKNGSDIWMRTPSGWIAAYYKGKIYIK